MHVCRAGERGRVACLNDDDGSEIPCVSKHSLIINLYRRKISRIAGDYSDDTTKEELGHFWQVDLKDKWRNLERQGIVGPNDLPAQPVPQLQKDRKSVV